MPHHNTWIRRRLVGALLGPSAPSGTIAGGAGHAPAHAQSQRHAPGRPVFLRAARPTSVATGPWSSPNTWSTKKIPGANDKVAVDTGHTVTYDVGSARSTASRSVESWRSRPTRRRTSRSSPSWCRRTERSKSAVPTAPIAPDVTAEIVIADQPFNPEIDPAQIGNGIVALGKVTMHGAVKAQTFLRLSREPLAGQTSLVVERPVADWRVGDSLVIPDTRQLRATEAGKDLQAAERTGSNRRRLGRRSR